MRLFSALPLAPECVDQLTGFRLRWSLPGDGLRWSTPEQWHITLRFFGDVDEVQARCLGEQFEQLKAPAPDLVLEGLDLFIAKGILVASVQSSPALLDFHSRMEALGGSCGVTGESRTFRPHITLARSKGRVGHTSLQRLTHPQLPKLGPQIHWTPAECLLLESVLRPGGAEYTVRSRIVLERNSVPLVSAG